MSDRLSSIESQDDSGVIQGIIDDLIAEGVPEQEIPEACKARLRAMEARLDQYKEESAAWAKEHPAGTTEFLKQFLADAE